MKNKKQIEEIEKQIRYLSIRLERLKAESEADKAKTFIENLVKFGKIRKDCGFWLVDIEPELDSAIKKLLDGRYEARIPISPRLILHYEDHRCDICINYMVEDVTNINDEEVILAWLKSIGFNFSNIDTSSFDERIDQAKEELKTQEKAKKDFLDLVKKITG